MRLPWICLPAPLFVASCLNVTEERVERDRQVGRAEREGVQVRVDDGLAAVRGLAAAELELWANAPELSATLTLPVQAPAQQAFTLRIRNVLPTAELTLERDGASVELTAVSSTIVTERRARFEPGAGGTFRLRVSAPGTTTAEPFVFLAFADVQDALDDVGDVFSKMNRESDAAFVIMAGDITERGTRAELERFQNEQKALGVPVFATLGNHELGTSDVPFHEYFGRGSQSFTYRGARFTALDSASATLDPTVYEWLDEWLERGRGTTHFVYMHVPPVDPVGVRNGCFSSRAESDKLVARLARGGITAAFYGHVHSYYSFEHAGIPAFISGGGGAIPERFDGIGRHFLRVSVDPLAETFSSRVVRVD
jgi:predicted phosphodiesterase